MAGQATVISWTIVFPIPPAIHYLAALGPALAAMLVTGLTGGSAGLKELLGRVLRTRLPVCRLSLIIPPQEHVRGRSSGKA